MGVYRRVTIAALLLLFGFLPGAGAQEEVAREATSAYVLHAGDEIDVYVKGHRDLDRRFVVPAEGFVSFHPIGRLRLAGRSLNEVVEEVTRKLAKQNYITDPVVYGSLRSYAPRKVYLWGAVPTAVEIPPTERLTLVQVLATASVDLTRADLSRLRIRRNIGGEAPSLFEVDLDAALAKGDYEKDLPVKPGDIIEIPVRDPRADIATVSILGKVNRPGRYRYDLSREKVTLLDLIADAGDLHQYAAESRIRILRRTPSEPKLIKVDYDEIIDKEIPNPELMPGDIVFVPESFF